MRPVLFRYILSESEGSDGERGEEEGEEEEEEEEENSGTSSKGWNPLTFEDLLRN